jgi:hypothetical protein
VLVLLVRAPERRVGLYAVRGHRVFGVARHAVREIEVTLGERRFLARRAVAGWEIDGKPASAGTAEALEDLAASVAGLRAVDVFRPRDASSFGFERAHATIRVVTPTRARRVVIGAPNAAGTAFYARRDGDPRVMQVGSGLLSGLERVFFNRDGPRPAPPA